MAETTATNTLPPSTSLPVAKTAASAAPADPQPKARQAATVPNNSLQEVNQRAIALASQGDARQAVAILEASLLADPESGPVFDNLRRLYAGFASQSYQLALNPTKAQPVVIKLSDGDRSISVQLPNITSTPPALKTAEQLPSAQRLPSLPDTKVAVNNQPRTTAVPQSPTTPVTPAKPLATPASQAQSIAPKTPTGTQPVDTTAAIITAVKKWANAWSAQKVNAYIAAYAPDYHPQNMSRQDWISLRRQRLSAPKFIKVELNDIKVRVINKVKARVQFTQTYTSNKFRAKNQKTLELTLIDNQWRITHESSR